MVLNWWQADTDPIYNMAGEKFGAVAQMEARDHKEKNMAFEDPGHDRYAQDGLLTPIYMNVHIKLDLYD